MNWIDTTSQAPATARYHQDALEQIIQCVRDGVYCAVLGPRLSGKTVLLRYVEHTLAAKLGWTCIYIDLEDLSASTLQGFFADLIQLTAKELRTVSGFQLPTPSPVTASSAVFRGFLTESVAQIRRDLVLIIEHLEDVPTDLVQALLTSLRAAYMDQQTQEYRVTVVISGALSLATLTVGESSPFRGIARRVFVGDLTADESQSLIDEYLATGEVRATRRALERLLEAVSGDHYLIRKLSQRCVELARKSSTARLGARSVSQVMRSFLRKEVFQYAPLLDAVRLIEENPDLLHCVLTLLERDMAPKSELPLPLSPDLDPLYLTGVVEKVNGDYYRLQNQIYRQFLAGYFAPGRVGHMLAMAGHWDDALDYLEAGVDDGDEESRLDLLPATINSMHAAQDLPHAAHFLLRGLSAAFGVQAAQVWYAAPQEEYLRLIGETGETQGRRRWSGVELPRRADRLETRAFRQAAPLRGQEQGEGVRRAIPLAAPGRAPIGVVTLWEDFLPERIREQRERDLQVQGYLNQAARALQAVSTRRQELALAGRMQASLLPHRMPQIAGFDIAATWQPARETSGDFYDFIDLPDGRFGLVIADVVDKGMGAALYMALSRTLLRTYASQYPDHPEQALGAANRRMLVDADGEHFVTLFFGILDSIMGRLIYCNAGHNPPYMFTLERLNPLALQRTGMALGVSEDAEWSQEVVQIPPGSALALYTDGVLDAQNELQEPYGLTRMLTILQANIDVDVNELQKILLTDLRVFSGEEAQVDDITLVVLKRLGVS